MQTRGMALPYKELAAKSGISEAYATQLLDGTRKGSLEMVLQIYDKTGEKFGILEGLSEGAIDELRRKAA